MTCPHCLKINRVAGWYEPVAGWRAPDVLGQQGSLSIVRLYCGYCGKWWTPVRTTSDTR